MCVRVFLGQWAGIRGTKPKTIYFQSSATFVLKGRFAKGIRSFAQEVWRLLKKGSRVSCPPMVNTHEALGLETERLAF